MTNKQAVQADLDQAKRQLDRIIKNVERSGGLVLVHDLDLIKAYLNNAEVELSVPEDLETRMEGDPAYVHLRRILDEAYDQSTGGKGKERHVREEGQPFEDQPICQFQKMYGTGGGFYQVAKKMEESQRLPFKRAKAELLGGIVYLAAAIRVLEETHGEETKE